MNPLNLEKALQLYTIIGKHLPENVDKDMKVLDFVGIILDSIIKKNEHSALVQSTALMSGIYIDNIRALESNDIIELFSEGLIINNVLDLKKFCKSLGGV